MARFRRVSVCSWAILHPRARRVTRQRRERAVSCAAERCGAARGGLWVLTRVFGLQRQPVRNHERSYSEAVPHQRWLGRYAAPFACHCAPARSVAGSSPAHAGTRSAAAHGNGGNVQHMRSAHADAGLAGADVGGWFAENVTRNHAEEQLKQSFATDPATHLA